MYVFLLDELSGGFNTRFDVRKDLDEQVNMRFVVADGDVVLPGSVTKTEDRKMKEAAILDRWREEQKQLT